MNKKELEKYMETYAPGNDCTCNANCQHFCKCGADWTDKTIYSLTIDRINLIEALGKALTFGKCSKEHSEALFTYKTFTQKPRKK